MKTPIRNPQDIIVEQIAWELWGYVRDNQNSLDSERACKIISTGLMGAMEKLLPLAVVEIQNENKRLKAAMAELPIPQRIEVKKQATRRIKPKK